MRLKSLNVPNSIYSTAEMSWQQSNAGFPDNLILEWRSVLDSLEMVKLDLLPFVYFNPNTNPYMAAQYCPNEDRICLHRSQIVSAVWFSSTISSLVSFKSIDFKVLTVELLDKTDDDTLLDMSLTLLLSLSFSNLSPLGLHLRII